MKSKEAFLEALQRGIAVLAESEQQDILEEYAQHIEMKQSGGLTEEEAVQDFGDIHQLIAEILEAYHVNPSYASGNGDHSNTGTALVRQLTGLGRWIQSGVRKTAHVTKRGTSSLPKDWKQDSQPLPSTEGQNGVHERENTDSCSIQKIERSFFKVLKATVWLAWNGAILLCAIPILCMGMAALLLMGVTVVWMSQGIPLVGTFLCSVGAIATCVGVLGLGKKLIWHRRRIVACQATEPQTEKEVLEDAKG